MWETVRGWDRFPLLSFVVEDPLIVASMLLQAAASGVLALSGGGVGLAVGAAVLLGLGTAMVYPTLIAAMSDAVSPVARAPVIGVYRFWRDMGYAVGALVAGGIADRLGYGSAIAIVAALTAVSGLWVHVGQPRRRARDPFTAHRPPAPHKALGRGRDCTGRADAWRGLINESRPAGAMQRSPREVRLCGSCARVTLRGRSEGGLSTSRTGARRA